MTEWYYVDLRHERQGPVGQDALVALYRNGALTAASLVWREGMGQWTPLGELAGELGIAAAPASSPPPPVAQEPAAVEPVVERPLTGRAVFTASEPTYTSPAPVVRQEPAVTSGDSLYAAPRADIETRAYGTRVTDGHVVYAGFWKRVAASFIDSFAVGIPVGIVAAIIAGLLGMGNAFSSAFGAASTFNFGESGISYVLMALTYGWFHSAAGMMATPGKLAIGIKVVRTDGDKISFLRGFARFWAYLLSAMLLGIGLLIAAFTGRKQALHDLMCDTLVVDKWAFTTQPERQREELGAVALVVLIIGGLLVVGGLILIIVAFAALASMGSGNWR